MSQSGETEYAGIAHLVERRLAKAEVAGSSPVSRSNKNRNCKAVPIFIRVKRVRPRVALTQAAYAFTNCATRGRGSKPVANGNFDRPVNGRKGFERAAVCSVRNSCPPRGLLRFDSSADHNSALFFVGATPVRASTPAANLDPSRPTNKKRSFFRLSQVDYSQVL